MLTHFRQLARYNRWANKRLYDAVAALPDGAVRQERPAAFFGSILGTLNHVLVGDRIWLARIEGIDAGIERLDQRLYEDLHRLTGARELEDARIVALTKDLAPEALEIEIAYSTMAGEAQSTRLKLILAHLFNHQTHHRGQTHGLLQDAGAVPPPLDLIYFLYDDERATQPVADILAAVADAR